MADTAEISRKLATSDGANFEVKAGGEVNLEANLETFTFLVPTDAENSSRVPEDYDYDVEASHNTFFWNELLPALIVYCLTFVLGLVGNTLIIFTIFRYRKMKSTTNVFLASLASSDLLLILFCIPVKLAKLFSFTWTFGFFLCKLVHYMQSVSAVCSVFTLTAMSLERYYAIVHPIKAQYICTVSQAKRVIMATWISAFLLAVPILFAQVHLKVGVKVEAYWCVRDWDNKILWRAHELYMMLLILVVPTGVMAVAYVAICWEIWEVIQRRQDMTGGKGRAICRKLRLRRSSSNESLPSSVCGSDPAGTDHPRRGMGLLGRGLPSEPTDDGASVKQVIKMLVAVVAIYVVCWGPMLVDNVLQAYGVLGHIRMGWPKHMGTTFHLLAYFNSCINPIIYGFMSKNFRESFRKTLSCLGKNPKTALLNFSLSQTRNTSIRFAESSFRRTASVALPV